ncbi:hypothetical protein ACWGI8_22880 [Streptomyces sp. NPDC054841]
MTEEVLERRGPMPLRVRWTDVAEVSLRKRTAFPGVPTEFAIELRLLPESERPPKITADKDGWVDLWYLGFEPDVPPELDAALSRFAGSRWNGLP